MKLSNGFIAILLLLALPGMGIAGESFSDQYFAKMPFRETPFADLRGIIPISQEKAKIHKHYRFRYDEFARLIEISFRMGDQIQDLNISRNVVTFAPVIRIQYQGNKEIRTFFDRHLNAILSNGVFREVYQLDGDGNRQKLVFFDPDGKRISSLWGIFEYQWQIDRKAVVTEQRLNEKSEAVSIRPGFPFYCLKLHYDQRGFLALMENYGKDCSKLSLNSLNGAQDKLQYDNKGNMYAWNVYDEKEHRSIGNGPKVARGIMESDDMGNTLREYYQDTEGNMMSNSYGWTDTYAGFDHFGNMISRFNHDREANRMDNPDLGYSGYEIQFDKTGQKRVSLKYLDQNLNPAEHKKRGYHLVESQYDQKGNLIRFLFKNTQGLLVNRKDNCAAIYEYQYDNKNRRIQMLLLDENKNPTVHCQSGWSETRYFYHPTGALLKTERK